MKLKKSLAVVLTSAALFSMCTGTMVEASKKGGKPGTNQGGAGKHNRNGKGAPQGNGGKQNSQGNNGKPSIPQSNPNEEKSNLRKQVKNDKDAALAAFLEEIARIKLNFNNQLQALGKSVATSTTEELFNKKVELLANTTKQIETAKKNLTTKIEQVKAYINKTLDSIRQRFFNKNPDGFKAFRQEFDNMMSSLDTDCNNAIAKELVDWQQKELSPIENIVNKERETRAQTKKAESSLEAEKKLKAKLSETQKTLKAKEKRFEETNKNVDEIVEAFTEENARLEEQIEQLINSEKALKNELEKTRKALTEKENLVEEGDKTLNRLLQSNKKLEEQVKQLTASEERLKTELDKTRKTLEEDLEKLKTEHRKKVENLESQLRQEKYHKDNAIEKYEEQLKKNNEINSEKIARGKKIQQLKKENEELKEQMETQSREITQRIDEIDEINAKVQKAEEISGKLDKRDDDLLTREINVDEREQEIEEKEKAIETREKNAQEKELALAQREREIFIRAQRLEELERKISMQRMAMATAAQNSGRQQYLSLPYSQQNTMQQPSENQQHMLQSSTQFSYDNQPQLNTNHLNQDSYLSPANSMMDMQLINLNYMSTYIAPQEIMQTQLNNPYQPNNYNQQYAYGASNNVYGSGYLPGIGANPTNTVTQSSIPQMSQQPWTDDFSNMNINDNRYSQINHQRVQVIQMPIDNTPQNQTAPIDPNSIGNINNINNAGIQQNGGIHFPPHAMQNVMGTGIPQMAPNINPTQNNPMMLPGSKK